MNANFWRWVDKTRPAPAHALELGPCWEWTGSRIPKGYGTTTVDGKTKSTHRLAWKMENGPIPEGQQVLHRCDNPPCVNPAHLFLGTPKDNTDDMLNKGRWKAPPWLKGTEVATAKLTDDGVILIRRLAASGEKQRDIARELGVSQRAVGRVIHRKTWRHVP